MRFDDSGTVVTYKWTPNKLFETNFANKPKENNFYKLYSFTGEYFYALTELISTPAEEVKTARVLCAPEKKKIIIINTRYKSLRNENLSPDSKTAYPFSHGIKRTFFFSPSVLSGCRKFTL